MRHLIFTSQVWLQQDYKARHIDRRLCNVLPYMDICRDILRNDGWPARWRDHICVLVRGQKSITPTTT